MIGRNLKLFSLEETSTLCAVVCILKCVYAMFVKFMCSCVIRRMSYKQKILEMQSNEVKTNYLYVKNNSLCNCHGKYNSGGNYGFLYFLYRILLHIFIICGLCVNKSFPHCTDNIPNISANIQHFITYINI